MTIHKTAHKNLIVIVLQKSMLLEKKPGTPSCLKYIEAKAEYYATCCQLLVMASRFKIKPSL